MNTTGRFHEALFAVVLTFLLFGLFLHLFSENPQPVNQARTIPVVDHHTAKSFGNQDSSLPTIRAAHPGAH
jgi:ABC-type uncharacterized transport system permease subunit